MKHKAGDLYLDPIVMDAFEFNADDMYINQQGNISDYQLERLTNSRFTNTSLWLGLTFIPPLIGIFSTEMSRGTSNNSLSMWMIIGLICAILLTMASNIWKRYTIDMYHNEVEESSYAIRLDVKSEGKNGISYSLYLGNLKFKLNKKQFLALKNREVYTVFYTPKTKQLLTIAELI